MWSFGSRNTRPTGRGTFLATVLVALLASYPAAVHGSDTGTLKARGDDDWESPVYNYIFQFPLPIPETAPVQTTYFNATTNTYTDFYEIKIQKFQQKIYPNLGPANLVGYNGRAPGPIFRMTKNREAVVRFVNQNDRPAAIHLHGSYSRAPFDGWAEDVMNPGEYKDYYYPNNQGARTLWYHDHAIHITAVNAYNGQAGVYILSDPEEEARLKLPDGEYDIPLVLQSKQYKKNGDILTPENERDSLFGDVIHVNGQPWPYLNVEPRKYRFRILDASISRAFFLTFVPDAKNSKPIPFQVIAADAGYFESAVTSSDLYISMAERYEVVIDFSTYKGQKITLKNARDVFKDEDYAATNRVMQFRVGQTVKDTRRNGTPKALSKLDLPPVKSTVDRKFKFERTNGEWRINGVGFADVKNRILAKPQRGNVELWELENSSGGWSHPIHIHLVDFKIVSRSGGRNKVFSYEGAGLKDVAVLGPNEKVRVLAKYAPWDGVYMFHCHNLVHEDHDMMGAFNVTVLKDFGYPETTKFIDPMEARWRAKPWKGTNLEEVRTKTLKEFSALDAYHSVHDVQDALDAYWGFPKQKKRSYPPKL